MFRLAGEYGVISTDKHPNFYNVTQTGNNRMSKPFFKTNGLRQALH